MRIDWWTLALQTVNVLILIWILARFFFRPVADIVAKRQSEANSLLSEAASTRNAADEARAAADKMRTDIRAEQDRLIAEARTAAQSEKQQVLAQASEDIAKLRGEMAATIARDREAAERAVIARATELAVQIAQRLLGRFPPALSLVAFLDGLCQELRALPSEARESFMTATADQPVEVATAALLSNEQVEQVRRGLKEAFDADIPLTFRVEPDLIAGIELHSRGMIVRNSWRADLDRIREELNRVNDLKES
ncbi:MAG: F0F1 ATP synthase subunit delta [Rhodoplanes sp.]